MIKRFLTWLGIELIPEEKPCNICQEYQLMLAYERNKNEELLKTITDLLKPKNLPSANEVSNLKPIMSVHTPFSARRAILERQAREAASKIIKTSSLIAKEKPKDLVPEITNMVEIKNQPKTTEELEEYLGV